MQEALDRYRCQECRDIAPTQIVNFHQNVGLLFARSESSIQGYLCKKCINKYFWKMTLTTLFAGWWGIISFFVTPIYLVMNLASFLPTLGMRSSFSSISVQDVSQLLSFLKQAFVVTEIHRTMMPDGRIADAWIQLGNSVVVLRETRKSTTPVVIHIPTDDIDGSYHRAIQAGASALLEPKNMPNGDRQAGVKDLYGNHWYISFHVNK